MPLNVIAPGRSGCVVVIGVSLLASISPCQYTRLPTEENAGRASNEGHVAVTMGIFRHRRRAVRRGPAAPVAVPHAAADAAGARQGRAVGRLQRDPQALAAQGPNPEAAIKGALAAYCANDSETEVLWHEARAQYEQMRKPRPFGLLLDGITPVLQDLKRDFRLGIIANQHPPVAEAIENYGIAPPVRCDRHQRDRPSVQARPGDLPVRAGRGGDRAGRGGLRRRPARQRHRPGQSRRA